MLSLFPCTNELIMPASNIFARARLEPELSAQPGDRLVQFLLIQSETGNANQVQNRACGGSRQGQKTLA